MSWTDEEIDHLFRDSNENASFEYKSEYWNEMETLLDAKKGRTGGDFLWVVTSLVFLGALTFGVWQQTSVSSNDDLLAKANVSGKKAAAPSSNNIENNNTSEFNASSVEENSVSDINSIQLPSDAVASAYDKIATSAGSGEVSTVGELNSLEEGPASVQSVESEDKPELQLPIADRSPFSHEAGGEPLSDEPTREIVQVNSPENELIENQQIDLSGISLEPNAAVQMASNETPEDLRAHLCAPYATASIPAAFALYVEANGGITQSLVDPSTGAGYSYGGGIGVQFVKRNFIATAGISGGISNHNDIQLSRVDKLYGFGSQIVSFSMNYKQLHYVEGSFNVGYNFGKHALTVGVRPSYMVSSKVEFERASEENGVFDAGVVYGHMEGINRWGVKPQFGYSYAFAPSWVVGMNVGTQLMPVFKDEYINQSNSRLPIDGQLYLRKTIRFNR